MSSCVNRRGWSFTQRVSPPSRKLISQTRSRFLLCWVIRASRPVSRRERARNGSANNERIFLAPLGATIQNIQLAVTACGLTSAWLSGGGEDKTNEELAAVLGYPPFLSAIGTVPVGYPEKNVGQRYRRSLEKIVHWNRYEAEKLRPDAMIEHYVTEVRPFAMYRGVENVGEWEDAEGILGKMRDFYLGS